MKDLRIVTLLWEGSINHNSGRLWEDCLWLSIDCGLLL